MLKKISFQISTRILSVIIVLNIIRPILLIAERVPEGSYISDHDFLFISGWPQSGTSLMQQIFTITPGVSTMVEKCGKIISKGCIDWNFEGQWILSHEAGIRRESSSNASILINPGSTCKNFDMGTEKKISYLSSIDFDANDFDHKQKVDSERMIADKKLYVNPKYAMKETKSTWKKFWNLDMPLLVEKSPHSMLKTELIREIYSDAKSVKFIIILKHPVTLNVALPRYFDWSTHLDISKSSSKQHSIINTVTQRLDNVKHFIHFMTHKRSGFGRKCTMGWLDAMEELHSDLQRGTNKSVDVKIVRFEDFAFPLPLCKSIYGFVYDSMDSSDYLKAVEKVCNVHFGPRASRKSSSTKGVRSNTPNIDPLNRGSIMTGTQRLGILNDKSSRKIEKRRYKMDPVSRNLVSDMKSSNSSEKVLDPRNETYFYKEGDYRINEDRRQLRLKWSEKSFSEKNKDQILDFIPEVHTLSTKKRLKEYHAVYRIIPIDLKNNLDVINEKLKKYGYSLNEGLENWYKRSESIFDPWSTKSLN